MSLDTQVQSAIDAVKASSKRRLWVVGAALAVFATPVIWMLVNAVLGAAALGASLFVTAAVALVAVNAWPVLVMKVQNAKIDAIIAEATKNPIPTMWNEWKKDGEEIEELRAQIIEYDTAIDASYEKIKKVSGDMTADDMAGFESEYHAQKAEVSEQYADLAELEAGHAKSEREIRRLDALWTAANAQAAASAKSMAARRMDAISAIKRDAAFQSVVNAQARAKAQVRARMEQRKAQGGTSALAYNPSPTLDPSAVITPAESRLGVTQKAQQ